MPLSYNDLANFFTAFVLTNSEEDKASPPDFKPNPNLGEGEARESEWNYRKEILNLLNKLYKAIKKIQSSNLTIEEQEKKTNIMIDDFIKQGKEIVKDHINTVYKERNQEAVEKLKDLGINKKKPTIPSDSQIALITYQEFSIEKIAENIRLDLKNRQLRNNYFSVAYGKSK